MKAKLVWPPHPYRAGFCITDDADAATFEQVKAVYDYLLSRNFRTTRTVWAFKPMDRCGVPPIPDSALRGITLQDSQYLDYCRRLHEHGFEICLHGASAGNNTREYTRQAFDFLERNIGASDTFNWTMGAHDLKFGGSYVWNKFASTGGAAARSSRRSTIPKWRSRR